MSIARGESIPMVRDQLELLESAFDHRMTGLLWSRASAGHVSLEEDISKELERIDLLTWGRHMRLWAGLERISDQLTTLGVEFAVLKGVVAEHRWYERVGERPCWDLDILIAPDSWGRLDEIVSHLQPDHALAKETQELFHRGLIQGVTLWVDEIPVDLHFDVLKLGVRSRNTTLIWESTIWHESPHLRTPVRVLAPETAVLHYLVHLARDRFRRLLGFVDIARVIESQDLDWGLVDSMARDEGIETPVGVALDAVAETLTLGVGRMGTTGWRDRAWRYLWRPEIRLLGSAADHRYTRRGVWLLPLLARGRTIEAARWWARTLFPPAALLDERHPGVRGPYLWRLMSGRLGFWWRQRKAGWTLDRRDA
jgi:hypothetical protein